MNIIEPTEATSQKSLRAISIRERYTLASSSNSCLSCGGALEQSKPQIGETFVDLGSGRGLDVLKAARLVGESGKAIGIDMTKAMLDMGRENASKLMLTNATFIESSIDNLPIDNNSVDVLISNCTINHADNKSKVYSEIYRVLKAGGRFIVSDIIAVEELPIHIKNDPQAIADCYGGAITETEYFDSIANAGFQEIEILEKSLPYPKGKDEILVRSLTIRGYKK
ncbi:MAG: methyltransferase domain-containing protein [Leptonema sp. (in: Bacteria)]|nr:methyltransferase domain-containing protein [Leptonema sp. (in: bacteria)]